MPYIVAAANCGVRLFLLRMLFEVNGFCQRFGRIAALSDVSSHVRAGEVLGPIGPNGAGKSTLFECVGGVLPSDSGTMCAGGLPVGTRERPSLLFYVPDGIAPWPAQPVRWALDFTIGFFGGRAEARDEAIEQLDLRQLLRQPMGILSKGQRKRALLGIGLLTPQPALLIDEPFEGLDLRQARDIAVALRAHAARGGTLFLSIHQIGAAARFCDRFLLLSGGRVCGEAVQELAALAKCATGPGPTKIWKRYFLRLRRRGPGFGPATGQEAYRTWLRLVDKEWRELAASRAWWILLLGMGPLVGASFIGAACVGHVDRHVRATVSRIVAAEGVLEAIYSIANVAPPAGNDEEIFRGHPLAVAPSGAGAIFYGVWPGLIVLGGILLRRRLG